MEVKYIKWGDLEKEVEGWSFQPMSDGSRIYYRLHGEGNGFDFKQVNLVSYIYTDEWNDKGAESEVLLHGTAFFDGIRHLCFGDERSSNYGYFYYPVVENIKEALDFLKGLEKENCSGIDF